MYEKNGCSLRKQQRVIEQCLPIADLLAHPGSNFDEGLPNPLKTRRFPLIDQLHSLDGRLAQRKDQASQPVSRAKIHHLPAPHAPSHSSEELKSLQKLFDVDRTISGEGAGKPIGQGFSREEMRGERVNPVLHSSIMLEVLVIELWIGGKTSFWHAEFWHGKRQTATKLTLNRPDASSANASNRGAQVRPVMSGAERRQRLS